MNRQKLHTDGPEFSKIAAGLWRLDQWNHTPDDTVSWIEACLEAGITTFDHADIYGDYTNETRFGKALNLKPSLRDEIELVTKCDICLVSDSRPQNRINHYNTTPNHIISSVEQSLKNLGTDYVDLVLLHRPDPLMDATATADALMMLINQQKAGAVGVSNFTPSQFDLLQNRLDVPLVTNQIECSLLHTAALFDGTLDYAQQNRYSPMFWSPFAGGGLFKKDTDQKQRVWNCLLTLSDKYEATPGQIALAWLLRLPANGIPVLGTSKTERIKEATETLHLSLERQDWFSLLVAAQGHPVP